MRRKYPLFALYAAMSFAAMSAPAAADSCKDTQFKVTNSHAEGREIEIRKVRYFNPHTGNTHTEDVQNLVCRHGATCTTAGDNLANAKNVDLNSIQIVFAFRERDKDWSGEFQTRPFVPTFRKCVEGKVYGPIVVSDNGG
jgi:hypothetical protein